MEVINIFQVYCITNLINNKKYIGITSRNIKIRFQEHCSHKRTLIYNAVQKYGKENFKIETLEKNISKEEIDDRERYFIKKYNTLVPNGYNLSTGGISNKDLNEQTKKRLSEMNMGIKNPRCNNYILQIDKETGEILNKFGSGREAARFLGNEGKNVSINYCLRGKQKTAYGYIWKYEDN